MTTITLQALSLVEKEAEPVQGTFTLRLRDQPRMWLQDGCKVYMDSYMASNASCRNPWLLGLFQKPPLGGRPNIKPWDHGTPNTHNRWFILFYHVWEPAWKDTHQNSILLRACSHMTSHYTWWSVTTLHDVGGVLWRPLDTFSWALTIWWSRQLTHVCSGPQSWGTSYTWLLLNKVYVHEFLTRVTFFSRVYNARMKSRVVWLQWSLSIILYILSIKLYSNPWQYFWD